MNNINHIKAYLLGLLVGGGKIDKDVFVIDLPFKKWGMDPRRMNVIAADILTKICERFKESYHFNVTYEIGNNKWLIKPINGADISTLIEDLQSLQLPTGGFLLSAVDLAGAKRTLKGISVESFLSGIFDARASLTLSHRRFNDNAPVVSVEIPGSTKNFKFVVQLCSWLTDLGSITDQILYNHPNQHSRSDPSYIGWKKGFKVRFLVKSFLAQHSFALQAKAMDINKIEKSQKKEEQLPCYLRKLKKVSALSVHNQQDSEELPDEVRNKIFFHYHHFCAVLQCPHAPVEEIKKLVIRKDELVNFFPKLSKGESTGLRKEFENLASSFFPEERVSERKFTVHDFISRKIFDDFDGLNQGFAYLFADKLNGKRHSGPMNNIIQKIGDREILVNAIGKDYDSPLLIMNTLNNRGFICSSVGNKHNQALIKRHIKVDGLAIKLY